MTDFKKGDRVRVVQDRTIPEYNGLTGTVESVSDDILWAIRVVFDEPVASRDGITADVFDDTEIELIAADDAADDATDEQPTPADPDLQALRERLLDKAIHSTGFAPDTDSVLATAKAFEAYVTGGTK